MVRKRYTPEQIIGMLREAEVRLSQGATVGLVCRDLGISEQSDYRWRRDYGGLKLDQAKRLKDLERENLRLRKAVSELTLDAQILKEALEGNYWALPASERASLACARALRSPSAGPAGLSASHARRNGIAPKRAVTRSS